MPSLDIAYNHSLAPFCQDLPKGKVALGFSGGVDSSVAAMLLQNIGCDVTAIFLHMHDLCNDTLSELEFAKKAAKQLDIPFAVVDMRREFSENVISNFVNEYLRANTPNPCVICNPNVKFKGLYDYATLHGFDYIATGHYATLVQQEGKHYISRACAVEKDQSYVLYALPQHILKRLIFPLGGLPNKEYVRKLAARHSLFSAQKSDSQEICFIPPQMNYVEYIEQYTGKKCEKGVFVDSNGKILGEHHGSIRYTIGQRRGLGVGFGKRKYVCNIDPENNRVIIGDPEDLLKTEIRLRDIILHKPIKFSDKIYVKIRYKDFPAPAKLKILENNEGILIFENPKNAPASGQSAVFYMCDLVIGGGIII